MLSRPFTEPRRSGNQKLLLAFAVFLLPWLRLVNADGAVEAGDIKSDHPKEDKPAADWAVTSLNAISNSQQTFESHQDVHQPPDHQPSHIKRLQHANSHQQARAFGTERLKDLGSRPPRKQNSKITDDASALATYAPASAVRAPHSSKHKRSSSAQASGVASPQIARSLGDWEVEDFVLLATVDGNLFASDRNTGKEIWRLQIDQPMVETKHYRANVSTLDDDYDAVDHYIWAVEPSRDGSLYVWIPDSGMGLVRTGFTMKHLVEELSPYAGEQPPVVYTGDKKTTMITLDAATGQVLKWFGSGGSHTDEAESCLRPNGLHGTNPEECSSTGTITLGRIEYTVAIHRRDHRPIATLRYSEWVPNNFDNDLFQQYHQSRDGRYISSKHDGKVYAFDFGRSKQGAKLYSEKFSSPVARVFDVCRPWDAPLESNPQLVILPQPPMPSQEQDEDMVRARDNRIFLNHTESGGWFALSGRSYPLVVDAPVAQIAKVDWSELGPVWDTISEAQVSRVLVGTHYLDNVHSTAPGQPPTLPPGMAPENSDDREKDNDSVLPVDPSSEDIDATIIEKFKLLPRSAANSVIDFISNPILIILFFGALIYNEKKLRQAYGQFRRRGTWRELAPYLINNAERHLKGEDSEPEHHLEPGVDEKKAPDPPENHSATSSTIGITPEDARDDANKDESSTTIPASGGDEVKLADTGEDRETKASGSSTGVEKKKKAHRGRRGGVKHKKGKGRENSLSRNDEPTSATVEEAVNNAKKLGDRPIFEPDVMTVANDMQAVTGPIIRMGNIEVNTEVQLGTGSNGTLVFAGKFDGREVAVKRMLIQFYDIASQETRLLRESDDHPNVIRYYSQQIRDGFLYIALERCAASLADVIERPSHFRALANAGKTDLPGVLYQITNGISHLHQLRIVHRDLKPQNILVNMGKDGRPRLLVSDFGLCKKLEGGQSSFGATTGRAAGTSGWRAPELLLDDDARDAGVMEISTHSGSGSVLVNDHTLGPHSRRATRAIDIFSLGLVFFYVLTNGSHPFDCGDKYMREVNIRKGNHNLQALDSLGDFAYEAKDLIASMLDADPKLRPGARDVMAHPFFWSAKKRLAFLCDVSDHFEKEPRDPPSPALMELERHAPDVTKGDFLRVLSREFVDSLGKQRKYTGTRLLDLLRALRNKKNHYEDMSDSLKRSVGPLPEGYLSYWTTRFPMLLLVCWNVVYNVQWEETDRFREYYEPAGL
ncbi:hypothetical protein NLU13_1085 [Sarocladium strictum]|uniref:non-specific serine/threonine protein kinase n=1 Tax=Sarocladium strictum TaxID=5046 RepID=A0AA39GQA3_SARSR|nr:hypothetical protein NLU13_1085 [Sarocladium strictum]